MVDDGTHGGDWRRHILWIHGLQFWYSKGRHLHHGIVIDVVIGGSKSSVYTTYNLSTSISLIANTLLDGAFIVPWKGGGCGGGVEGSIGLGHHMLWHPVPILHSALATREARRDSRGGDGV